MNKKKILIVDDEEAIGRFLSIVLEEMGYEIVGPVTSGKEAIAIAAEVPIDMAIVDIALGGDVDGIEVCKHIKKNHDIHSIYISGHSDDDTFLRAKATEPLAYFLKPINVREFEMGVDLALSKVEIKKRLIESEYHYKQAQEIGNIGSWNWDIENNNLRWTDQIYRIFGLKPQEFGATYESFLDHIHPDDVAKVNSYVERALAGEGSYEIQHRLVRKNGDEREVVERGEVMFNQQGQPIRMQGTVQDVTELNNAQKQVQHLAYYDIITGLPNRNLFFNRLEQSLALQRREIKTFAVLAIDLDGFKEVNDTHGHIMGDKLLEQVAMRLKANVRDVDMVARTGGDEFMGLIWGIAQAKDIKIVAEKLVSACAKPFDIDHVSINISCSVGVAICPDHGNNDSELIMIADKAMYRAKNSGKNTFRIHEQ